MHRQYRGCVWAELSRHLALSVRAGRSCRATQLAVFSIRLRGVPRLGPRWVGRGPATGPLGNRLRWGATSATKATEQRRASAEVPPPRPKPRSSAVPPRGCPLHDQSHGAAPFLHRGAPSTTKATEQRRSSTGVPPPRPKPRSSAVPQCECAPSERRRA